jgi:purine nucleosidase
VSGTRGVVDTDPGVDDAVALLLALASPELDVGGVSTVNGNGSIDQTTLNARRLLSLAGRRDIPVARGADRPLVGAGGDATEVHGTDGLSDLTWNAPDVTEDPRRAVELIADLAAADPLTIIAIGPLTNLAHLECERPDIVDRVERVVVMGGASLQGNVTPAAEFNIWVDPEAAGAVLAAGWAVDLMPLDLTHQAFLTDDDLAFFRSLGSAVGERVAAMLEPYACFHEKWHLNRNLIMHDATAVYNVIDPTAIAKEGIAVHVETGGEFARGATFIHRSHTHGASHVRVGTRLDNDRFVALVRERLASY